MSILSTSPQDNRLFSAEIAAKLGDLNAAVIVQQLHYWMGKEGVGTIIRGVKYIYNSFNDWVKQFPWLSVWQFRKAMKLLRDLRIVRVIRYKSRQWNQTNYYTLDCDRLLEYLNPKDERPCGISIRKGMREEAETIETVELCVITDRDVNNQQIEVRDSKLSLLEQRKTNQKETAESRETSIKRSQSINSIAAASPSLKKDPNQKNSQEEGNTSFAGLNGLQARNKAQLEPSQKVVGKENKFRKRSINVTKTVNSQWKSLVDDLDGLGVPINKTLVERVKMYSEEEVRGAIALVKIRKQEKHIPNLAGYFTAALKGGWSYSKVVVDEREGEGACFELGSKPCVARVDTATAFRLWYDLARELGYCTSQEIREGEQWVLISGTWEKWSNASDRGYSLEYLKKVKARNRGR